MHADIVIPGSAIKAFAEGIARIFTRRTVDSENNWNSSSDSRGQILMRAGSSRAFKVRVEPINIKSAIVLDPGVARVVAHGEELIIVVELDKRVAGLPTYWVRWSEGFAKRYKSQVRVTYPPQVL